MKTIYIYIFINFLTLSRCLAGVGEEGGWGSLTNDVEMSVSVEDGDYQIKTNQTVNLLICLTNVSTSKIFYVDNTSPDDSESFAFKVTSPSEKDISPHKPIHQPFGFSSGGLVPLPPQRTKQFSYKISDFCKFDEVGKYKIVVKKTVFASGGDKPFIVVSNPSYLNVVPGYWKSETTNPPPFFNYPQ